MQEVFVHSAALQLLNLTAFISLTQSCLNASILAVPLPATSKTSYWSSDLPSTLDGVITLRLIVRADLSNCNESCFDSISWVALFMMICSHVDIFTF